MNKLDENLLETMRIPQSLLYNGYGLNTVQCRKAMKEGGFKYSYGVSQCIQCGHTIRTISWNCIHCSPSSIKYESRYREGGYVYIGSSEFLGLIKIGSCKNIKNRINSLRDQKYAGADDWKIIKSMHFTKNSGEIENKILQSLKEYSIEISYKKDGRLQRARELLNCPPAHAFDELNKHILATKRRSL
ncbi:GIY-YIG nuclease family protein [Limnohabitans sp. Jir72]|jgi:hypothetical protein|uniref:GIY-YIG nuclease family protein n=1 Tax=Limnohabitans sp. Jir72 TaxID=1977909 RepID=UPI001304DCA1|nr:GIY-YIG nuclease family protein [Limnohabitans sp. Jir72]